MLFNYAAKVNSVIGHIVQGNLLSKGDLNPVSKGKMK
jgi:hypothetical protein